MKIRTILLTGVLAFLSIPALALVYWLASPLWITEEVNDEFNYAIQAVIPTGMSQAEAEGTMQAAAQAPDVIVDDPMPTFDPVAVALGTAQAADATTIAAQATPIPPTSPPVTSSAPTLIPSVAPSSTPSLTITPAPNVALLLRVGEFIDGDEFHLGEGQALWLQLPDGTQILRFENFNVTNGPDLHVLLSRDGTASNAIDLGALRGNVGNQNYDLPLDANSAEFSHVIIYCVPFQVLVSIAPLSPPSP